MSPPKNVHIPHSVSDAVDRIEGLEPPLWYVGPLADVDGPPDVNGNSNGNGAGHPNGNGNGAPRTGPRQVRRKRRALR